MAFEDLIYNYMKSRIFLGLKKGTILAIGHLISYSN